MEHLPAHPSPVSFNLMFVSLLIIRDATVTTVLNLSALFPKDSLKLFAFFN
jgi:hypothetical protein